MTGEVAGSDTAPAPRPALDPAALDGTAAFEELVARVASGDGAAGGALWGSAQAFVLARLIERLDDPFVVVCSKDDEAAGFALDLEAFGIEPVLFPARESGALGADSEAVAGFVVVSTLTSVAGLPLLLALLV